MFEARQVSNSQECLDFIPKLEVNIHTYQRMFSVDCIDQVNKESSLPTKSKNLFEFIFIFWSERANRTKFIPLINTLYKSFHASMQSKTASYQCALRNTQITAQKTLQQFPSN